MNSNRIILWHWEALYPFDLVEKGLTSLKLPEEFPKDSMYIALPHDYLVQALENLKDSKFLFGSSDMLDASPGCFTGDVAATFLVESQAKFVIIGKAFDRNQIKETSASINNKIKASLKENIIPFFCFGETREEYEDGHVEEVINKQIKECLATLSSDEIKKVYFIYDTPGAIKTISDITRADLDKVHAIAQKQYISIWGEETASQIKTICSLEPFKPLPISLFENSPFSGFYFKMIDANLAFFCNTAKELAPFFELSTKVITDSVDVETSEEKLEESTQTTTPDETAEENTPHDSERL